MNTDQDRTYLPPGNGGGPDARLITTQVSLLRQEITERGRRQDEKIAAVEQDLRRLNDQQLSVLAGVQAALTNVTAGVNDLASRVTHASYMSATCFVTGLASIVCSLYIVLRWL